MKRFLCFVFSCMLCFSVLSAESSAEVERIFAQKDYAAFEKYVNAKEYEIGKLDDVYDYVFKGDDTKYIDSLVKINCTRVFNWNIGHDGGYRSLAAECALNNNIKLLKYCYSIGLHINGEGKIQDESGTGEESLYFEDVSYFIWKKCSDEIVNFLWQNEPLKNKWYYSNGWGERDYKKQTLLMDMKGMDSKDFIHYSELLNLKSQVNTICYYHFDVPRFATLYDELYKEIERLKKWGNETSDEVELTLDVEKKLNYVKSIGGKSFYAVFSGLSAAEKEKLIKEYTSSHTLYTATVNTDALRLRDGCDLSSKVVGKVVNGDVLYVLNGQAKYAEIDGMSANWCLVYSKEKGFGYCFGGYLKYND